MLNRELEKIKIENLEIEANGFRITGKIVFPGKGKEERYPVVVVCHGFPVTPEPVEKKGYLDLASKLAKKQVIALIFNFRGTVGSEGYFSIKNWAEDVRSVVDFIGEIPEAKKESVGLLSFSLGAYVSFYSAAADDRVKFLVSCSSPAKLDLHEEKLKSRLSEALSKGVIRVRNLKETVNQWVRDSKELCPLNWIGKISPRHVLIVHGGNDEIISVKDAYKLYAECRYPKELLILEEAGHKIRRNKLAMNLILRRMLNILKKL